MRALVREYRQDGIGRGNGWAARRSGLHRGEPLRERIGGAALFRVMPLMKYAGKRARRAFDRLSFTVTE